MSKLPIYPLGKKLVGLKMVEGSFYSINVALLELQRRNPRKATLWVRKVLFPSVGELITLNSCPI